MKFILNFQMLSLPVLYELPTYVHYTIIYPLDRWAYYACTFAVSTEPVQKPAYFMRLLSLSGFSGLLKSSSWRSHNFNWIWNGENCDNKRGASARIYRKIEDGWVCTAISVYLLHKVWVPEQKALLKHPLELVSDGESMGLNPSLSLMVRKRIKGQDSKLESWM